MIAIHGIYDGKTIRPLEPVHAPVNARVIITFIDESRSITATRLEDVAGSLKWSGPPKTLADMNDAISRGVRERNS